MKTINIKTMGHVSLMDGMFVHQVFHNILIERLGTYERASMTICALPFFECEKATFVKETKHEYYYSIKEGVIPLCKSQSMPYNLGSDIYFKINKQQ